MPYLANPAFSQPEPVAHIRLKIPPRHPPSSSLLPSAAAAFWICGYPLSLRPFVSACGDATFILQGSPLPSPPHSGCLWGKEGGGRSRGTHFSHFRPNNQIYCIHGMNSSTGSSVCTSNSLALSISHSLCLHGIAAAAPLLLISAAARSLSLAALAAAAEFSCTLLASQGSTSDTEPHGTSFRHE